MADPTPPVNPSEATELETDLGPDFPTPQTAVVASPDAGDDFTTILLPQSGTLWVVAEREEPAELYVWHQGGARETITMNTPQCFQVEAQDALVYAFKSGSDPNFKLVWAYA